MIASLTFRPFQLTSTGLRYQNLVLRPSRQTPTTPSCIYYTSFRRSQNQHSWNLVHPTVFIIAFIRRACLFTARRLCPKKLKNAKDEFHTMQQTGIIKKFSSQWSSPLHIVHKDKAHGDHAATTVGLIWRDFLTGILFLIKGIHEQNYLFKIDLIQGYPQIPIFSDDEEKNAITTSFWL